MSVNVTMNWFVPESSGGSDPEYYLKGDIRYYLPPGLNPLMKAIQNVMREALASPHEHPNLGWWTSGGKIPSQKDDSVHLFGYRKTEKTPDFKERCAKGEILMNNYSVCRGVATYGPRHRKTPLSDPKRRRRWYPDLNGVFHSELIKHRYPYYSSYKEDTRPFYLIDNVWRCGVTALAPFTFDEMYQTFRFGDAPDPRLSLEAVGNYLQQLPQPLDHPTVQQTLANANAGDVDVLTAVAEMPKLIESITNGFALVLKIFKDVKKREFKAYATVPTRERILAKEALSKKKLKALRKIPSYDKWARRRSNRGKKRSEYEEWLSDRMRHYDDLERFLKESRGIYRKRALREIAEAMSSVYLNALYNIIPNVKTVEDSLDAMDHLGDEYRRWGNGGNPVVTVHELELPGIPEARFEGEAKTEFRCLIKRRYVFTDLIQKIDVVATGDVLVTGYELIKLWSIVFDWFFSISTMLRAIPWNRRYSEQKACVNWKTTVKGKFHWERDATHHTLEVEMERFERDLYNPVHSIGIYFNSDGFGLKQQLAALAFAFQAANPAIRRRYYF